MFENENKEEFTNTFAKSFPNMTLKKDEETCDAFWFWS